jgi:di/tricarboxylate transporter
MLGAISTKSGLPQRIGNFIVSNVGFSYSRILLGLIITDFLLTFIVPTGTGRVVILAAIAIGLIKVFGVSANSNVARGIFLIITYTATIFDKMIIAARSSKSAASRSHGPCGSSRSCRPRSSPSCSHGLTRSGCIRRK